MTATHSFFFRARTYGYIQQVSKSFTQQALQQYTTGIAHYKGQDAR